jgi:hypothetical protein
MDVKSTLKVYHQADHPGKRGVTDGQTYQRLVGWPEVQETDRVRIGRATYKPGTRAAALGTPSRPAITSSPAMRRCARGPMNERSRKRWSFSTSAPPTRPTARSNIRSIRKPSAPISISKTSNIATPSASNHIIRGEMGRGLLYFPGSRNKQPLFSPYWFTHLNFPKVGLQVS